MQVPAAQLAQVLLQQPQRVEAQLRRHRIGVDLALLADFDDPRFEVMRAQRQGLDPGVRPRSRQREDSHVMGRDRNQITNANQAVLYGVTKNSSKAKTVQPAKA